MYTRYIHNTKEVMIMAAGKVETEGTEKGVVKSFFSVAVLWGKRVEGERRETYEIRMRYSSLSFAKGLIAVEILTKET
jgi:hypothetical protein